MRLEGSFISATLESLILHMSLSENRFPLFRDMRLTLVRGLARWQRGSTDKEEHMTKLIAGIALLFLVGGTGSSADAATPSWCVFYDGSTYNCSFYSWEQCYETARGSGGWCRPNFFQGYNGDRPVDRKARGSRY
jgi:Protein of unknown function (DUF3551)